jgi:hypothetical protein
MGSLYLVGGVSVPAAITWFAFREVTVKVDSPPLPRERLARGGPFGARLTEEDGTMHQGQAFLTHSEITPERERYTLLVMVQGWEP